MSDGSKSEGQRYLETTMKTGRNGAVYSRRPRSSERPDFLRGDAHRGFGGFMVGDFYPRGIVLPTLQGRRR